MNRAKITSGEQARGNLVSRLMFVGQVTGSISTTGGTLDGSVPLSASEVARSKVAHPPTPFAAG